MSFNETPRANRVHIGIFGRINSGKSSLLNALTDQEIALVSEVRGTTTDPVYKSAELHPVGACVFIDTAGFDDESLLGAARIKATERILDKTDVALLLFAQEETDRELEWLAKLKKRNVPVIPIINKSDVSDTKKLSAKLRETLGIEPIEISALKRTNLDAVRERIAEAAKLERELTICAHLVDSEDVVLLVMPQDLQAPKGRLILPQIQTIRELLDHRCIVMSVTLNRLPKALSSLKKPPRLVITDSQVFPQVKAQIPGESMLTSFSVLFARYKGDIDRFVEGARTLGELKAGDRVLIAEACTHNPLDGDIGRVKLPSLLRKNYGELDIRIVSGADFPDDLSGFKLIIHCGSCMFNRKYVLSRLEQAKEAGVPMTNYGIAIAYMNEMMDSIIF